MEVQFEIKSQISKQELQLFCDYIRENIEDLSNIQLKVKKPLPGEMGGDWQEGVFSAFVKSVTSAGLESFIKNVWKPKIYPRLVQGWNIIRGQSVTQQQEAQQTSVPLIVGVSLTGSNKEKHYFVENGDGSQRVYDQINYSLHTEKTYAVLIGSGSYRYPKDFHDIPPITGNIDRLFKTLSDKTTIGIPAENITILQDKSSDYIQARLYDISTKSDIETLLIYYAGHGYQVGADKLYLAAANSFIIDESTIVGAVDYDFIRDIVIKKSKAKQKILLLDSCHSGLAVQASTNPIYDVEGSYILASSAADKMSYFKPEHKQTFFTGAILDAITNGVDTTKERISLNDIYEIAREELISKKLPEPIQKRDLNIHPETYFVSLNPIFSFEKLKDKPKKLMNDGKEEDALFELELLLQRFPDDQDLIKMKSQFSTDALYRKFIQLGNNFFYKEENYHQAVENYNKALQIRDLDQTIRENIRTCKTKINSGPRPDNLASETEIDSSKQEPKENVWKKRMERYKEKFIHLFEADEDELG